MRCIGLAAAAFFLVCTEAARAQELTPEALARKNNCMACHGLVHKEAAPGFAEIARRYRNDAAFAPRLATKIRNGSVGSWGRRVMPQQPQVSEAEALELARWVLSRPPPPPR